VETDRRQTHFPLFPLLHILLQFLRLFDGGLYARSVLSEATLLAVCTINPFKFNHACRPCCREVVSGAFGMDLTVISANGNILYAAFIFILRPNSAHAYV
jgi:hypothetical protein